MTISHDRERPGSAGLASPGASSSDSDVEVEVINKVGTLHT